MVPELSIGSEYREEIDELDDQIIDLLAERFDAVAGMHIWKHENGIALRDHTREQVIIDKYAEAFGEDGIVIAKAILGVL